MSGGVFSVLGLETLLTQVQIISPAIDLIEFK